MVMDDRSQAVRPQESRLDTDRVGIPREDRNVPSPVYQDWEDYFENAPKVGSDFVEAMSGARDLMPLEDREPLD